MNCKRMRNNDLNFLAIFLIFFGSICLYYFNKIPKDYDGPTLMRFKTLLGGIIGVLFGLYLLICG